MKISDVSTDDGKMIAQLLNFLKVADLPKDMKVADCMALSDVMNWLNGLVKLVVGQLSAKKDVAPAAAPAAAPSKLMPLPKKKGKK